MSRHPADHRAPPGAERIVNFAAVARRTGEEGSHPAARAALRRADGSTGGRRTREFLRIDRGRET
jgi:hypothetical protein